MTRIVISYINIPSSEACKTDEVHVICFTANSEYRNFEGLEFSEV
jgi:hypothetical protein